MPEPLTDKELVDIRKMLAEHVPINPVDKSTFEWLQRFDATIAARDAKVALLQRNLREAMAGFPEKYISHLETSRAKALNEIDRLRIELDNLAARATR